MNSPPKAAFGNQADLLAVLILLLSAILLRNRLLFRLRPEQKVAENLYKRGDGTLCYFFSTEEPGSQGVLRRICSGRVQLCLCAAPEQEKELPDAESIRAWCLQKTRSIAAHEIRHSLQQLQRLGSAVLAVGVHLCWLIVISYHSTI